MELICIRSCVQSLLRALARTEEVAPVGTLGEEGVAEEKENVSPEGVRAEVGIGDALDESAEALHRCATQ